MRVDRRACLGNGASSEDAKQVTASKAVQCNRWSDFMIHKSTESVFERRGVALRANASDKKDMVLLSWS